MPTIDECISAKGDEGLVDQKRAARAAREYRDAVADIAQDGELSVVEAERLVAQRFVDTTDRAAAIRKSNAIRSAAIQKEILESIKIHEERGIPADIVTRGRLTFDPGSRYTGVSLENRINTVRGQAHSRYADALKQFRTKWVGLTGREAAQDEIRFVMRELFGDSTGNAEAKQLAKDLQDTMEYLRTRFNAAGGDIAKRENYGLHQSHDQSLVLAANKDEWVDFTLKLLDRDKMLNSAGKRMSDRQLLRALGESYDSISTGGATDLSKPRGPSINGSAVNRRANHRFLSFKSGDAWMAYHERFGVGDLQDHVLSSMGKYARDIGELEVLGPHSEATLRFMQQVEDDALRRGALSAEGNKAIKLAKKVGRDLNDVKGLYDIVTGRAAVPAREGWAKWGQSTRNVLVANQLGSAFLVALSDIATATMTSKMNGMSATNTLSQIFKTFATDQTGQRELALQLGFAAQGWASHAIGAQRFTGELAAGHAFTEKAADTVLRASLLTPITEAGRYGFQIEMSGFITRQLGSEYDKLPKMLRESMKRYGLEEADWKVMQKTAVWEDPKSGARFLRAQDIYDGEFSGPKFEAANKMQQMILTETQFAIVSNTSKVRQFTGEGKFKKGTFWGEVLQSVAMYKSFPLSIMHTHLSRAVHQTGGVGGFAAYVSPLMLGMTLMGGIGMQANQIASGKDPRNMYDGNFWVEAMTRGGSLGLMGDVLFQEQSGIQGGLTGFLAGPAAANLSELHELTVGNIDDGLSGEDTNIGRDIFRFAEGLMPGRTIWYAKLLQERLFYDMIERMADPDAQKAWARSEQRARDDHDQRFYSRPGRMKPSRAPNFGAALGE